MRSHANWPCKRDHRLHNNKAYTSDSINRNLKKPGWLIRSKWKNNSYKNGLSSKGKHYPLRTTSLVNTYQQELALPNLVNSSMWVFACTKKASKEWRNGTGSAAKSKQKRIAGMKSN
jgi:hypothetical protein